MNRRIFEQGQSLNAYQMGSTLAALFWCGNKLWVCNIGDSRVFGLHGRHLLQLSVDHTDEAFLRERGITNRKPYLTQYLGMDPNEILLVPAILGCLPWREFIGKRWGKTDWYQAVRYALALAVWLLSVAMLLGESYNPFIYFRF